MFRDSPKIYLEKYSDKYNIANFNLRLIENLAAKTLRCYARNKLKPCRDNIDFIMNYIVRGYTTYDPTKGLKLQGYLINKAKYAIKHLLSKKRKKMNKTFSLDSPLGGCEGFTRKDILQDKLNLNNNLEYNEILSFIEESSVFNQREKAVLIGHFKENTPLADLAEQLNIHRTYVYLLLETGLDKLKRKFYDE